MRQIPIKHLSGDTIDNKPVMCDWREEMGEDMDGWQSYEEITCGCGHTFVAVNANGCTKCGEDTASGPAMNYYYPVPILPEACKEAAQRIGHLPLCVVEFRNGTVGLALTGGGMDLSWEIIRAHLALGFMPPVHFCPPTEMAGWEKYADANYVLAACQASAQVVARRARYTGARIREMQKQRRAALKG